MSKLSVMTERLSLAFGFILFGAIASAQYTKDVADDVVAIHKLGIPSTYQELADARSKTGEDAAPYYRQYIEAYDFTKLTPEQQKSSHILTSGSTKDSTVQQRHEASNALRPMLDPLFKAAACSHWTRSVKELGLLGSSSLTFRVRGGIRLLCQIAISDAESGDSRSALDEIGAALRISGQQAQFPSVIGYSLGAAEEAQALDAMKSVMVASRDDRAILEKVKSIIVALPPEPDLRFMLTEDYLNDIWVIKWTVAFRRNHLRDGSPADIEKEVKENRRLALRIQMWRETFEQLPKGEDGYRQVVAITESVAAKHKSDPDFDQLGGENNAGAKLASIAYAKQLAVRSIYSAAIDALLSRVENGTLPASLPAGHVDPYSGQPLIYKSTGNSLTVYSVGPNLRDDGGVSRSAKVRDDYDIVYHQEGLGSKSPIKMIAWILGGLAILGAGVAIARRVALRAQQADSDEE